MLKASNISMMMMMVAKLTSQARRGESVDALDNYENSRVFATQEPASACESALG